MDSWTTWSIRCFIIKVTSVEAYHVQLELSYRGWMTMTMCELWGWKNRHIEYSLGSGRFLIHDHCRYTEIRKEEFSSEVLASDPGGLSSVILLGHIAIWTLVVSPLGTLACSGGNSQWLEFEKVWGSQISFTCLLVIWLTVLFKSTPGFSMPHSPEQEALFSPCT